MSLQCIKQIIHTSESIYINIYTDSEYALKCITTWCTVWKSNNWKTSKKKPVKNKDIIILCVEIMSQIKSMVYLSLHHVKSHTQKHD
jgi:ribonuclease HI